MAKSNKSNLSLKFKAIFLFLWMSVFAACVAAGVYNGVVFTELMLLQLAGAVLGVMVGPLALVGLVWAGYSLIKDALSAPAPVGITMKNLIDNLNQENYELFEKNLNEFIQQNNASEMLSQECDLGGYAGALLIKYLSIQLKKQHFEKDYFEKHVLALINLIEPGKASQGLIDKLFYYHTMEVGSLFNINMTIIEALLKKGVSEKNKSELLPFVVKSKHFKMVTLLREHGVTYDKKLNLKARAIFERYEQEYQEQIKAQKPEPIVQQKVKKIAKSVAIAPAAEPVSEKIKRCKKSKLK